MYQKYITRIKITQESTATLWDASALFTPTKDAGVASSGKLSTVSFSVCDRLLLLVTVVYPPWLFSRGLWKTYARRSAPALGVVRPTFTVVRVTNTQVVSVVGMLTSIL